MTSATPSSFSSTSSSSSSTVKQLRNALLDHHYHLQQAKESFVQIQQIISSNPTILKETLSEKELISTNHVNIQGLDLFRKGTFGFSHRKEVYSKPIHWATVLSQDCQDVVKLMLSICPDMASAEDSAGTTPFHISIFPQVRSYSHSSANNHHRTALTTPEPPTAAALTTANTHHHTPNIPLNQYQQTQSSSNWIQFLKELVYANSTGIAKSSNRYGATPLHMTSHIGLVEPTRILLQACVEAASVRDVEEYLPIHYAIEWDRKSTVKCILQETNYCEIFDYDVKFGRDRDRELDGGEDSSSSSKIIPLWKEEKTLWKRMKDAFTNKELCNIFDGSSTRAALLQDAIGAVSISDFNFLIDVLKADVTMTDDSNVPPLLLATLLWAAQNLDQWDEYYKHILSKIITELRSKATGRSMVTTPAADDDKSDSDTDSAVSSKSAPPSSAEDKTKNLTDISSHLIHTNGSHYLHIAMNLGLPWKDCIHLLLQQNLSAFSVHDVNTGLLPFMCGVTNQMTQIQEQPLFDPSSSSLEKEQRKKEEEEQSLFGRRFLLNNLSASFELLRFKPDILEAMEVNYCRPSVNENDSPNSILCTTRKRKYYDQHE